MISPFPFSLSLFLLNNWHLTPARIDKKVLYIMKTCFCSGTNKIALKKGSFIGSFIKSDDTVLLHACFSFFCFIILFINGEKVETAEERK